MVYAKHIKDTFGNMMKRYEYWASENGKPIKKFTTWFNWDSNLEEPWQMKNKLKNEFKN